MENQLKFTHNQLQIAMNNFITSDKNGINNLFDMLINSLMIYERTVFLKQNKQPNNKANGFRTVLKQTQLGKIQLSIPRDRIGAFKPIINAIIDKQQDNINQLCYELYGSGLTQRKNSRTILDRLSLLIVDYFCE